MKLSDYNIRDFGNTIQVAGAILYGHNRHMILMLPGEPQLGYGDLVETVEMDSEDWKTFLAQTDLLEVEMINQAKDGTVLKAIMRKSQRQIDQVVSWNVYRRDGFRCRYCGNNQVPLTVDHVICWEAGGPTIEENLVAACKKCNRARGDTPYMAWLLSDYYRKVSRNSWHAEENEALLGTLDKIPRVVHIRSR